MTAIHTTVGPQAQQPHNILSLGAGVQSTTLLMMSCNGDLPPLDAVIFVDTGWEMLSTYKHLEWIRQQCNQAEIPLHIIDSANIHTDALRSFVRAKNENGHRCTSMPYHVLSPNGKRGILRRQCSKEYKVIPILRKIRQVLGYRPRQHLPTNLVNNWIGISFNERRRARKSPNFWCTNHYPLIEQRMTRTDCLVWLHSHGYPQPTRSSCVGCPYHSDKEWRRIRDNELNSWAEAVYLDQVIRNRGGIRGQLFLHHSCAPLADVNLDTDYDRGQLPLFPQLQTTTN
ncbi:MAG: hypothetical protein KAY24_20220 [Candidatus Eisenbacteria sp.]|nr:hypothetical protein [Candidatus Eisenbacteria bacterium]